MRPQTRLVLANTRYFQGSWAHVFEPGASHAGVLHRLDGRAQNVKFMRQVGTYRCGGDRTRSSWSCRIGWQAGPGVKARYAGRRSTRRHGHEATRGSPASSDHGMGGMRQREGRRRRGSWKRWDGVPWRSYWR
ncbi:MAG: hypothetical protein JW940_28160 [Polyangiaceae bacterium]|nr:hypothetical protein [Polyangiaceae bacterium]